MLRFPNGELKDNVQMLELAGAEGGSRPLAGIQVVRLILENFRYTRHLKTYYTHRDIARMNWLGDDKVQTYLNEMERLFKDLGWKDEEKVSLVLEHTELVQDEELKNNIFAFRALAPSGLQPPDPKYCLDQLKEILVRFMERKTLKKNLAQRDVQRDKLYRQMLNQHGGGKHPQVVAPVTDPKGKGKKGKGDGKATKRSKSEGADPAGRQGGRANDQQPRVDPPPPPTRSRENSPAVDQLPEELKPTKGDAGV